MNPIFRRAGLVLFAFSSLQPLLAETPATPVPATAPVPAPEVEDAISKVYPALVRIYVVMEEGSDGRMRKMQGSGSGTIISPEGHVLTNHHVAGRGTRFVCTLSTREEVDATLIGTDALADLAIIKLDLSTRRLKGQPLPVAGFGDSDKLKVGDPVLAMGSPAGLSQSVTRGIVANTEMIVPRHSNSMVLDGEQVGELVRWIGHDAVIYPGNSGGPLVNFSGEIVGVNEVGIASLGGAIPSNLAKKVAAELIQKGSVTRSWIGLEVQPLLRDMTDAKGALVASVWKDSPAAQAGIQAGDLISTYNGATLPDCHAEEDIPLFNAMVLNTPPNTKVTLTGVRDGKPQTWEMTTVVREPTMAKESELRDWGITSRDFTRVAALENSRDTKDGALVDSVRAGGPSAEAKPSLRPGDVIVKVAGKPVRSWEELRGFTEDFTKGLTTPKPVLVEFERDREKLATVVKVGPKETPPRARNAEKAYLGAATQVITDELATALGIPGKKGVRLTAIGPDSPASKAGLKEGDLLLKLDGRVINARRPEDSEVFPELILAYPVDSVVSLEGQRDGQPQTWSATLIARPVDDTDLEEYKDDLFEFTAKPLTMSQRDEAKEELHKDPEGVAVSKVESSGWAQLGGLSAGDIILTIDGETTNEIGALKKKLIGFRDTKPRSIVFGVRRGPRTRFLEIEPRW
jgi:serine protease Do